MNRGRLYAVGAMSTIVIVGLSIRAMALPSNVHFKTSGNLIKFTIVGLRVVEVVEVVLYSIGL